MLNEISIENIEKTVSGLDSIKHVDENGNEYWSARELSKELGYKDYRNFKNAIDRTRNSLMSTGKNPDDWVGEVTKPIVSGKGRVQEIKDYKLTRPGAYLATMNGDPSKPSIDMAQNYFLIQTNKGEQVDKIFQRIQKRTIETRNYLSDANKDVVDASLTHNVPENELGIVMDSSHRGMFNMSTKELKKEKGIPDNRAIADFEGREVMLYQAVAQNNAAKDIKNKNLNDTTECSQAVFDRNRQMRELYEEVNSISPEDGMTLEDVKKTERRYNHITKKMEISLGL